MDIQDIYWQMVHFQRTVEHDAERLEELLKQYKNELGPDGADCEKAAKPKVIVTLR